MTQPQQEAFQVKTTLGESRLIPATNRLSRLPWWALVAALLGVIFAWTIATNNDYNSAFTHIVDGLLTTIAVTLIAYPLAVLMGLVFALGRISHNVLVYQASTFYVEITRGVPTLVLLLYVAFAIIPGATGALAGLGGWMVANQFLAFVGQPLSDLKPFSVSLVARVIVALAVSYSAFISEILRAGIQSIDPGQMEASRALGMTYWQAMFHVILRQGIRQVLPALGNDFIAMLKDSSLVSALGVQDITLQTKVYDSRSFNTFVDYTVLAYLYLVMTLLLSMAVKWLERRMARERKTQTH